MEALSKNEEKKGTKLGFASKLRYGVHIVHSVPLNSSSPVRRLVILTFERCLISTVRRHS